MRSFWSTIEAKVKWSTYATFAATLILALLNATAGNSQLLGPLPPWLQFVVVTFGPAIATALAGYRAKHTAIPPVKLVAANPQKTMASADDLLKRPGSTS